MLARQCMNGNCVYLGMKIELWSPCIKSLLLLEIYTEILMDEMR